MLTEQQKQLARDIADKLESAWVLRFRNVPPAPDTLLGCGVVLALMRLKAAETKNPFFPHSEIGELVGYALALPELKNLDRERFSDDLVRICVMFRVATVGYHSFILEDDFFIKWLAMSTYNA